MANVLVRGLDPTLVEKLKLRARLKGRSLQAELKEILENGAAVAPKESRQERAERFQRELQGRLQADSVDLIREDRER
ncbi:MAG: hypothetical protein WEB00_12775 [Dehalococcoidia bacterium]